MPRPSPLQNRAAPDGSLHAVDARGLLMGNRGGRLHWADGTLGAARWRSRAWIACRLTFHGRQRAVMGAGYTEIFFLDEATALAAGHRPCFECRRAEALAFAAAWARAHGLDAPPRAGEIDRVLHAERLRPPDTVPRGSLPPGAVFRLDGGFRLSVPGGALAWSFGGYTPARDAPADAPVVAVTPAAVRAVLAAGYAPGLHPSAEAQLSAR
ncbi:MAG: hypothetical protein QM699_18635 [Amaricoccus sp.]|uniref:hypothetical protein n=1 Tax=Amaricoccus sp. TaxID=1872485 RepID=UPI0039E22FBF